jgi:putative ABC transport system substrate-binding protein
MLYLYTPDVVLGDAGKHMRRREFITLVGGAAAAWPLGAHAQQPTMPMIGFLNSGSPGERAALLAAFRQGLKEAGYVEGQNVGIEYRWAEGHYDRLTNLAADLARRKVAVIVATGGVGAALAAKAATTTIPIVFTGGGDPVEHGLVASLGHPGGNATGATNVSSMLSAKRLDLLRAMVPNAKAIGMLVNPTFPDTAKTLTQAQEAAVALGLQFHIQQASSEGDFDAAFGTLKKKGIDALYINADALFLTRREQLVGLAARYAFPTLYPFREFVITGGLMSYGANISDEYRQAGVYVGRILKGEKPADLPVIQPTKFELVINRKTAKAQGIEIPANLLALADEVID